MSARVLLKVLGAASLLVSSGHKSTPIVLNSHSSGENKTRAIYSRSEHPCSSRARWTSYSPKWKDQKAANCLAQSPQIKFRISHRSPGETIILLYLLIYHSSQEKIDQTISRNDSIYTPKIFVTSPSAPQISSVYKSFEPDKPCSLPAIIYQLCLVSLITSIFYHHFYNHISYRHSC